MPSNRTFLAAAVLAAAASFAQAQQDAEAKAKLQRVAAAIKDAKSFSYTANLHGEGAMFANFVPKTKTTVIGQRNPDNPGQLMYRVTGRAELMAMEPVEYLVVCDGPRTSWVDHSQKTVYERLSSAATNQIDSALLGAIRDILDPSPLAKELEAPAIKLEAPTEVDGVKCDVIYVDMGETSTNKSRWTVGADDHFPRKIERMIQGGGMNDSQVWVVSNIKLNGPVPEGTFALSPPDGYTVNSIGTGNTPRPRAIGTNIDDLAPDFELTDADGKKVKLSSLKGSVVVLDFWGTWCIPCKKASPELQKIVEDYKDKPVKVYGLAIREASDEKPIAYMKDNHYTYGLLLKGDDVAKTYKVKVFPSYFVIGKNGEIIVTLNGFDEKTFTTVRAAIEAALIGKTLMLPTKPPPLTTTPADGAGGTTTSDK